LVCDANPEAVLELAADGRLITLTPTGGETSHRNSRLLTRLQNWADLQGGWMVFDSFGGFRLDDGSVLSPDAAVPYAARWPPTWPTTPGWAGCCLPSSGLWRSGGPVAPQMLHANPCGLSRRWSWGM
jgi:hypothetical protein